MNPTLHELGGHAPTLPALKRLGLFGDDDYPWSVFINDLRVISETCENVAVFLHYLVWRSRLPLGDKVDVSDELDLWGSYLFGERFGMLGDAKGIGIANSSTDFDAYYDGVMGRGPERPAPRKFLVEPARGFVERMAQERPAGWRDAAGVCLDLSIPELAVLAHEAKEAARVAAKSSDPVYGVIGRLAIVGVPTSDDVERARELLSDVDDATFAVFVALRPKSKRVVEVVWAEYLKPVTFALSDFERMAHAHLAKAMD